MITIATYGSLRWESETEDAGPYYLTNRFMILASFGTRSLSIGRHGSIFQRQAFEESRAAFRAVATMTDATNDGTALRRYARAATEASRAEVRRWGMSNLGGAENLANFQRDVDQRFEKALGVRHD